MLPSFVVKMAITYETSYTREFQTQLWNLILLGLFGAGVYATHQVFRCVHVWRERQAKLKLDTYVYEHSS